MMKIVAHLDMDAFFTSVEEKEKPYLKGLPLVVGSDPIGGKGRGVVSTSNYLAREYGIYSAMPIREAWRRSEYAKIKGRPSVIFITPESRRYSEASFEVEKIIGEFIPKYEKASIDEFYLDLSFCESFEESKELCLELQSEILKRQKLSSTIGIGKNKLIAKIASDYKKPFGFTAVEESRSAEFLSPMSISVLPGIGPKTKTIMENFLLFKVRDIQLAKPENLQKILKNRWKSIRDMAYGESSSEISTEEVVLSMGEQETFLVDIDKQKEIMSRVILIADRVFERFRKSAFVSFRTVVLIVRFSDFKSHTRSVTLKAVMRGKDELRRQILKLVLPFLDKRDNPGSKSVRLLGVRIEKLS
ncbi:MAG: hypothetical protein COV70_01545 [Parcubacteria group bacterium CG11_big_fil_rev_8_21_14_0_20_39_22]|nr:MAG: hypothetical protein COV70_01545 [Parcubacteria group bacterium CG11_big_fil_rev_8_21_14_0_20_39_22]